MGSKSFRVRNGMGMDCILEIERVDGWIYRYRYIDMDIRMKLKLIGRMEGDTSYDEIDRWTGFIS